MQLIGTVRTGQRLDGEGEARYSRTYPLGVKVPNADIGQLLLTRARLHGDWNCTDPPRRTYSVISLFLIGPVSLLVGGIGIMNIMLVSITERNARNRCTCWRSARWREVLLQFLVEAVTLSLSRRHDWHGIATAASMGLSRLMG